MGFTTTDAWIDEAITFGLPWAFHAPMTPKEFAVFWGWMSETKQCEYVYASVTNGKPFSWPPRQMFWSRPKSKRNPPFVRAAIEVIDRRTRP